MVEKNYITKDLLKNALRSADFSWTPDEEEFADLAVSAASRKVDDYTKRRFWLDDIISTRRYRVNSSTVLRVDDFDPAEEVTVVLDTDGDGSFSTTWAVDTDFELGPLNVADDEPQNELWALGASGFTGVLTATRAPAQVAAKWGWPTVPDEVVQATLLLAIDMFKSKSTPFGVAGINDFGTVRVRENAQAVMLLSRFVRWSKAFA